MKLFLLVKWILCDITSENQELHETISELRRDIDVGHDANDEYFQGMVIKLERMERERDDMKTARDRLQVQSCVCFVAHTLARAHAHASTSFRWIIHAYEEWGQGTVKKGRTPVLDFSSCF